MFFGIILGLLAGAAGGYFGHDAIKAQVAKLGGTTPTPPTA